MLSFDVAALTAERPGVAWIELTSKCPFDCVFCTRKQERGTGEHMPLHLYRGVLLQLGNPRLLRLNYSGESTHYPHLTEAIRLARATGAVTELVTALASATDVTLRGLVDAGLHRLSVSLHTTSPEQYRRIYGFGSLERVHDRLSYLQSYKQARGVSLPDIDFAFVAMEENLEQLQSVAAYAKSVGASHVSVHPLIRRGPTASGLSARCEPSIGALDSALTQVHGISVSVARPRPNPEVAGVPTCDQNPWDTIHVLADGTVAPCEVQDKRTMGNLSDQSLTAIWNGPAYQRFRDDYLAGRDPVCETCSWRQTTERVRGWHPRGNEEVHWAEGESVLALNAPPGIDTLRVTGVLPPGASLKVDGGVAASNHTSCLQPFTARVPAKSGPEVVRFETSRVFCPADEGFGPDLRRLGFALTDVAFEFTASRRKRVARLLSMLESIERLKAVPWRPRTVAGPCSRPGVSVIIPSRDTPELLAECLQALGTASKLVSEPVQVVVVESGGTEEALTFQQAIRRGLAQAVHSWVYLLNSDMFLAPNALATLLPHRAPSTFAIGSRIRMRDGSSVESNWTSLRFPAGDAAELVERNVGASRGLHDCLYAGGGSALFQTALLRRFIRRTRAYEPFYWEDADWGAMAWRLGYVSRFCVESEATHVRRATVSRYYTEHEISRIFERNRTLFHLRNLTGVAALERRLLASDDVTWSELFNLRSIAGICRARAAAFLGGCNDGMLQFG